MIFAFFSRLRASQRVRTLLGYIAAFLVLIALLWLLKGCVERDAVRDHEREIAVEVDRRAISASHAATDAAATVTNQTEKSNNEARRAADDSDDPLRAAFDNLRER